MCLHWIRSVRGWGPWRRQWKCLLVVWWPVVGSKSLLGRCSQIQWLSEETTYLGFHAVFNTALMACPWPWKAKREGGGGRIGDFVVVGPIHQWNLTLCPDGTKSGLQLMGTSPSSKGHLAGISHTPPHAHTYQIPDMHTQNGSVQGLLTLLYTVTWLSYSFIHVTHLHVSISSCHDVRVPLLPLHCATWCIYRADLLVHVLSQ